MSFTCLRKAFGRQAQRAQRSRKVRKELELGALCFFFFTLFA
jgi:hypothetical protein